MHIYPQLPWDALLEKDSAQLTPEGLGFHYMLARRLWGSFQFFVQLDSTFYGKHRSEGATSLLALPFV